MVLISMLLGGAVLLYFAADWLVLGSSNLALRLGVPPLLVGLTVVAFGTSAPELVVSVKGALEGLGSIAVGNVVGSNIFNIAVILGVSAIVRPLRVNLKVLRVDTPLMLLFSILFVVLMKEWVLSGPESAFLLLVLLVYIGITIFLGKKSVGELPIAESVSLKKTLSPESVWKDAVYIAGGLLGLILGSHLFVTGAVDLAELLGVSEAVIALTIVATGTSLPELATSIVAAYKKQEDIAIGNIIGSNIFNILGILGVSGLLAPLRPQGIGMIDLIFMTALAALLLPLMRSRFRLDRYEGIVFILIYIAYLIVLWP